MSLVANDIDTSMSRLRLVNTNSSNNQTTLKTRFLKDAQHYSAVVKSFYTNSVPPLFSQDYNTLISIYPKEDEQKDYVEDWSNHQNHFLAVAQRHTLSITREHHHDMVGFIQYVSEWFDEFNRNLYLYGSDFGADNQYYITPPPAFNPAQHHNRFDPTMNVGFAIDSAGRCLFHCSDAFLSQFFIKLDAGFAKRVSLPEIIFAGMTVGVNPVLVTAGLPTADPVQISEEQPFLGGFEFQYEIQAINNGDGLTFQSKRPIYLCDERSALLVEMSLPFSRTVNSVNGKHQEVYRLAEFPIDNYVNVDGTVKSRDGRVETRIRVTDSLQGGLIDFTKGFPETHVVHFLPGDIQAVNTRLSCNYITFDGVLKELPFLVNGFWDLELLFMKKVT